MSLHAADRDPDVSPGVDFYRFANGGWLDRTPIPPGYGAWGAFEEVQVGTESVLHDLLLSAADGAQGDIDRMVGDYFAAGMDLESVEAQGIEPIQPFLGAVAGVQSWRDVLAILPSLHAAGLSPLFAWGVTPDHDDSSRYLLWLVLSGLGLPDRDSYDSSDDAGVALRAAYVEHVAHQLRNLGWVDDSDAASRAAAVLAFETELAELHLRAEERRDPDKTLNRRTPEELGQMAPDLDLASYLAAVGASGLDGPLHSVNVEHPDGMAALGAVLAATPVATLRDYLAFQVVSGAAAALPTIFGDEAFEFYGRRIGGQQEQKERFKRVIAALSSDIGEALSQSYVATTFPPQAKEQALRLVEGVVAAMRESLRSRPWMTEETKQRGLTKLDAIRVKIGYPDTWRSWEGLAIDRTSYAANRIAAARFDQAFQLAQLRRRVDVDEWEVPPHVVNAYYHPTRNEIVFPAAILQPPMFDADADPAVNFGAIGAVIGHEITHGFDDQGRRFDADGAFRDWWTPEDQQRFTQLADRLVEQFNQFEALEGVLVNGRLTLGENIADLGGLTIALRALQNTLPNDVVDGLTRDQRFFLAAATVWRAHVSDELQRTLAQVDPHSPRRLRVQGPLANLTAFQEAFGLPDDAPMLRPPAERIEIW